MLQKLPREGTVLWRLLKIMHLMPASNYIELSLLYNLMPDILEEHIRGELNKNTNMGKRLFKRSRIGSGKYRLSNEGRLSLMSR